MKKMILSFMCLFTAMLVSAEGNLVRNGDFETILKKAKSTDKYLMNQIKNGWDFGPGPLAVLPKHWHPNGGQCRLQIITVGANGENKTNVRSGKNSVRFTGKGAHIYTSASVTPGKYDLSFWYKGSGTLRFCFYCYGINPTTGKPGKFLKTMVAKQIKVNSPEWKEFRGTIQAGGEKQIVQCTLALNVAKCDVYLDDVSLKPSTDRK